MQKLSRDSYSTRGRPAAEVRRDGLVLFAFLFASCALLVFSRLGLEPVHWLRWRLVGTVKPMLEVASVPIARVTQAWRRVATTVDALSEIEQLRQDNQRLRGWEWRAHELQRKLTQVSMLAVIHSTGRMKATSNCSKWAPSLAARRSKRL